MSFTTLKRLSLSIGGLAIILASASTARAQSCKDTTECPQGFVCEQYARTTPEPSPAPTPAQDGGAAPTASDLPASSGAAYPADIAPATGGACRPAPCTADSQCGAGMVCLSSKTSECTAPAIACAPGSKCDIPTTCVDKIVSTCAYKWQLPCNTDLDCGANFVCNPSVTATCAGGGGTGTPGSTGSSDPAGAPRDLIAPAPPEQMCTTTTSFPGYCQPKATTCTADSECPAAWACKTVAQSTPETDGPTRTPAQDGGTASSQGGNTSNAGVAPPEALPKPPEETVKVCVSPLGYGGTATRDPAVPGDTKNPDTTTNPQPEKPNVPPTGTGNPASGESDASPKAGCAVGGSGGSSFALLAFGMIGLALARRRRS